METNFFTQAHSIIDGRNIWLYLITCPIGNIYIVESEDKGLELHRFYFGDALEAAQQKYEKIATKMLRGLI